MSSQHSILIDGGRASHIGKDIARSRWLSFFCDPPMWGHPRHQVTIKGQNVTE